MNWSHPAPNAPLGSDWGSPSWGGGSRFGDLGATATQYRDVRGRGGYQYRQYADGTVQIIAGPAAVGTVYKPDSRNKAWVSITNEIGAPAGASWANKVSVWAQDHGLATGTYTASSTQTTTTPQGAIVSDQPGWLKLLQGGASALSQVATAQSSAAAAPQSIAPPSASYTSITTPSGPNWGAIAAGVGVLALVIGGVAFVARKKKS